MPSIPGSYKQQWPRSGIRKYKGRTYKSNYARAYKKRGEPSDIDMSIAIDIYPLNDAYKRACIKKVLLIYQGYACAICDYNLTFETAKLDHDHKTGLIRGVLCFKCNHGIGYFDDNIDNLLQAIDYLS